MRSFTGILLMLSLIIGTLSKPINAEDWPMLSHDLQHLGKTSEALTLPLVLENSITIGGNTMFLSTPIIEGDIAYLSGFRQGACIKSYNIATGEVSWEFCDNDRDLETACVYGDYLYVSGDLHQSSGSRLYKINKLTGALDRYVDVPGEPEPPCISDGVIYVGYCKYWSGPYGLLALDAGDLSTIWNFTNPANHGMSQPAVSSDGSRLYSSDAGGTIRCINASSGSQLWSYSSGHAWGVNTPTISGSTAYFVAGCNNLNLYALNANSGAFMWQKHLTNAGCGSQTQAVSDNIFFISADETLYALDLTDQGNMLWTFRADGGCFSPSVAGDVVYVATDDNGAIYGLNPSTGEVLWSNPCSGTEPQFAGPAIGNGHLLFYYRDASTNTSTLYDYVSGTPVDTEGPEVQFQAFFNNSANLPVVEIDNILANDAAHGNSNIAGAKYAINSTPGPDVGIPLGAKDGDFDNSHEVLNSFRLALHDLEDNTDYTVNIRAYDEHDNWSAISSATINTISSGYDPIVNDFNFKNYGPLGTDYLGFCLGMVIENEKHWRYNLPLLDNNIPLPPGQQDPNCPLTTAVPPWYSPTRRAIEDSQTRYMGVGITERVALEVQWHLDESDYLENQYEYIKAKNGENLNVPVHLFKLFLERGGHSVLAYRTAESSDGQHAIFVYDPNYPNQCLQSHLGIFLNKQGSQWSLFTPGTAYETGVHSFSAFGISLLPIGLSNPFQIIAACPVDLEVTTSLGGYVAKDSVSDDGFTYSVRPHSGQSEDSTYIAVDFGLDYPDAIFDIAVIPHDTATSESVFSLLIFTDNATNMIAQEIRIGDIPQEGYQYSTFDTGSISGVISDESSVLIGIPVDLHDSSGVIITSATTDENGQYEFSGLINGDYSVSIATPLGYQADEEIKEIHVRGLQHEIDFALTELEIIPQQRSRGYWAHQLHKAFNNRPRNYTLQDFSSFAGLINTHFNQNQLNPVDFYSVPQPADQADSLVLLRKLLHMRNTGEWEPFLKRLAKAQLMTLMLNVVSGKVSQTQEISADGRTISQAITYCDMLINEVIDPPEEGGPGQGSPWCRYIRASFILRFANLGITVPSGMIPEDVIEIAYKLRGNENLPYEFMLYQNYPNPFNASTEIRFSLSNPSEVKLDIFDATGQKVATLIEDYLEAGEHRIKWDGSQVTSGIYFYRLDAGYDSDSKKMALIK
ncbi:MAG: PQQ-binding-like beta-propeller repeat protein [candidate division Zixibacteria bacterium]|nr:PQQ-binding-like beta-propeller repeat protein [candidate division Zixibacteria bacterium]